MLILIIIMALSGVDVPWYIWFGVVIISLINSEEKG